MKGGTGRLTKVLLSLTCHTKRHASSIRRMLGLLKLYKASSKRYRVTASKQTIHFLKENDAAQNGMFAQHVCSLTGDSSSILVFGFLLLGFSPQSSPKGFLTIAKSKHHLQGQITGLFSAGGINFQENMTSRLPSASLQGRDETIPASTAKTLFHF